ncbi:hypothetical protein P4377_07015 [Bacillus thuringiensis]|nr:hypothetical protein [Bacillus thuringiensis]
MKGLCAKTGLHPQEIHRTLSYKNISLEKAQSVCAKLQAVTNSQLEYQLSTNKILDLMQELAEGGEIA